MKGCVHVTTLTKEVLIRPEYPRPDWQRTDWLNLNGEWDFGFDNDNQGLIGRWHDGSTGALNRTITVPFSWASPLSGIGENVQGVAWYRRTVRWTPEAEGSRLFLRFGAVDYECQVWVNQTLVGSHRGGYGTFELEVSSAWKSDQENVIVIRVEDQDEAYQTRGKQGYGEIRGLWQTVWIEARPEQYVDRVQFLTELDGTVTVKGVVQAAAAQEAILSFDFDGVQCPTR